MNLAIEKTPAVFATHPFDGVSDKYAFISTKEVVDKLIGLGFEVARSKQNRTRKEGMEHYAKHQVVMRQSGARAVGDVFPEIQITNSHGYQNCKFFLDFGLYRLACLNGLTVGLATFERIGVRHTFKHLDNVIEGVFNVVTETPKVLGAVEQMRSVQVPFEDQLEYAHRAAALRWDETYLVEPKFMLNRNREADRNNDLFTIYNVVQEKLIRGAGINVLHENQWRKPRPVTSIDTITKINRELWDLTMEYAA